MKINIELEYMELVFLQKFLITGADGLPQTIRTIDIPVEHKISITELYISLIEKLKKGMDEYLEKKEKEII